MPNARCHGAHYDAAAMPEAPHFCFAAMMPKRRLRFHFALCLMRYYDITRASRHENGIFRQVLHDYHYHIIHADSLHCAALYFSPTRYVFDIRASAVMLQARYLYWALMPFLLHTFRQFDIYCAFKSFDAIIGGM